MSAEILFGISDVNSKDLDLKINRKLQGIIGGLYAALGERLPSCIDGCIKLDER